MFVIFSAKFFQHFTAFITLKQCNRLQETWRCSRNCPQIVLLENAHFWVCLVLKSSSWYTQNLLWLQICWCPISIRYKGFRQVILCSTIVHTLFVGTKSVIIITGGHKHKTIRLHIRKAVWKTNFCKATSEHLEFTMELVCFSKLIERTKDDFRVKLCSWKNLNGSFSQLSVQQKLSTAASLSAYI